MTVNTLPDTSAILEKPTRRQGRLTDSSEVIMRLLKMAKQGKMVADKDGDESDSVTQTVVYPQVMRKLLVATQFRDADTLEHVKRVAQLAIGTARSLGWETPKLRVLEAAALLHDIGKISVPDHVLLKPDALSPEEAEVMAVYHSIGLNILQGCQADSIMMEYIQQAHKSFIVTKPYEKGMKKERTLGARILAAADAYESLSSHKPYRDRFPHEKIQVILKESTDPKFDDRIVAAIGRWVENEGREFFLENQEDEKTKRTMSNSELAVTAGEISHIFSYLYLLENLYDGYYVLDENMQVAIWNRGAEELLMLPWQKMYRKKWTSRMLRCADSHGLEYQERDYPVMRAIAEGETINTSTKIHRPDGSWVDLKLQTVPLLDENNKLVGVIEIFKDVKGYQNKLQSLKTRKANASQQNMESLASRTELESQLQSMLETLNQNGHEEPLSLFFLDIDFFKTINDTFGHAMGDEVLEDIAKLLQNECVSGELVSCYAGQTFVVLCPDTNLQQATRRSERLRMALPKSPIGGLDDFQVTASFGVTQAVIDDQFEGVLERAKKALRNAKESGRNITCSVTCEEVRQKDYEAEVKKAANPQKSDPFLFETEFSGFSAHDMIVFKLKGFIEDQNAEVIEVGQERALITIGSLGMFKRWGKSDERKPLELEITFQPVEGKQGKSHKHQLLLNVKIVPLGKAKTAEMFDARAQQVVRVLKSYFSAS